MNKVQLKFLEHMAAREVGVEQDVAFRINVERYADNDVAQHLDLLHVFAHPVEAAGDVNSAVSEELEREFAFDRWERGVRCEEHVERGRM